jgi:hypothetical protein
MTLTRTNAAIAAGAAFAALVLAGGGAALASYSGTQTSGSILTCWKNSPTANVRLVDHFPCARGETPVSWNAKGVKGDRGAAGLPGLPGAQGVQGAVGISAASGVTGAAGRNGSDGAKGDPGATGPRGLQGERGLPGVAGHDGTGLSVYSDNTLLGPLTAAYESRVWYLDAQGVVTAVPQLETATQIYFAEPDCGGTPYVGNFSNQRIKVYPGLGFDAAAYQTSPAVDHPYASIRLFDVMMMNMTQSHCMNVGAGATALSTFEPAAPPVIAIR